MKDFLNKLKNMKPADSPRKKEKAYQPPQHNARRFGAFLLWGMITFIFLSLLANTFLRDSAAEVDQVEVEENLSTKPEAVEFAQAFTENYFTWTADVAGWSERSDRLAGFLASGLDEQAGLVTVGQEWDSRVTDIQTMQVVETGTNRASITVRVSQVLTKEGEEEDERRERQFMFAIPVGYQQAYAVYNLPSFTAVNQESEVAAERITGTVVAGEVETNIKNFLNTFFQSYGADGPDKLSYFLDDPMNRRGLEGVVQFDQVNNSYVFEGSSPGEYRVSASVTWVDLDGEVGYLSHYELLVAEDNGRYIVKSLNKGGK